MNKLLIALLVVITLLCFSLLIVISFSVEIIYPPFHNIELFEIDEVKNGAAIAFGIICATSLWCLTYYLVDVAKRRE